MFSERGCDTGHRCTYADMSTRQVHTRYRLRTPCHSEHSVFIGHFPTNGRRFTLQPNLSVATRPTLNMRILAPHSTLVCPRHHTSNSHQEEHCIPRWQTASRHGYLCRDSAFNLKSCSQTGLICIFSESVTPSKQIGTSGAQVRNGTKEWTFSFC